jgi:hypothetical protein
MMTQLTILIMCGQRFLLLVRVRCYYLGYDQERTRLNETQAFGDSQYLLRVYNVTLVIPA